MRRTLPRGERTIRVVNGEEAEVEAIGGLPLEISNDFTFYLHDVLYVPSMMMMDLIAFLTKKQYLITFNDDVVGSSFRHDKLYLISIKDSINVVSSENNMNVSPRNNKHKRIDNVSSKL
jgi:hypothetical protein